VLVLSRKQNQSLVIGDNIVITVLSIDRDQIRLGIEAPRDISIMRQELYAAVKEQELIEKALVEKPGGETLEKLRKFLAEQISEEEK
jgi:carbon storage regulator